MKKKMLIGVLLLIELCSLYLMYKLSSNKEVLDNKEIKEEKKEKFAIMVQDDTGKYNKSSDTKFPSSGYYLNTSMSECLDIEGNKIENAVSGSNGSVTLTNKYTSYCTLYFDKCLGPKGTVLEGKSQITECPVGGMYRYQGTDNVNNWICFGTTSNCSTLDDLIDKYMYRIIGVTPDGQLALIKETFVKEGSTTKFEWDDKWEEARCGTDGLKCIWPLSKIYNRLNGLCNSSNSNCKGSTSGSEGDTNIFIGNSYYEYLSNSTWLNKISDHEWKYGESTQLNSYNGDNAYAIENAFKDSVPSAKIGLQYIHDYYYGYPGGNPGNATNAQTSWIYFRKDVYNTDGGSYEWLISNYDGNSPNHEAWREYYYGRVDHGVLSSWSIVRPVFYLTPSVKINNASGSKTDPFIITN